MPSTMRAAVYYGQRDLRIEERPVPRPSAGELLVRVSAVGVCGTDAAEWAHGPHAYPIEHRHPVTGHVGPLIPGHEFAGYVTDTGDVADRTLIGRLVACGGVVVCGRCRACLSGSGPCVRYSVVGLHRDGALAEYVAVPAASCVPISDGELSDDEAALCQPMAVAQHACRRARVAAGEQVIVLGIGGIGAFLVAALVHRGVQVAAIDPQADRRATAQQLGASAVAATVAELGDAGPVDAVFEVSGREDALRSALSSLRPGTRLVLVGIQKAATTLDLGALTVAENDIVVSNGLSPVLDLPPAVEAIAAYRGRWGQIAPPGIALDQLVEGALDPISRGAAGPIKRLIVPSG